MASISNLAVVLSADASEMGPGVAAAIKKLSELDDISKKAGRGSLMDLGTDKGIEEATARVNMLATNINATADAANALKGVPSVFGAIGKGDWVGAANNIGKVAGIDLGTKAMDWAKGLQLVPGPIGAIATAVFELGPLVLDAVKALGALIDAGRKSAGSQLGLSKSFGLTSAQVATMQFALRAAGTTIDEARPAISHFQKTLSEAANGSIEARGKFAQLGVNLEALNSAPASEQMRILALRFKEIKSPAERTRLAMEIFGRSGADALKMVNKFTNLEGFERMAQQTRSIVSVADAAKLQALKDAEEAASARSAATTQGLTQQIAIQAAPTMEAGNNIFAGVLTGVQPILNAVMDTLKLMLSPGDAVLAMFSEIGKALEPVGSAIMEVVSAVGDLYGEITGSAGGSVIEFFKTLGSMFGWVLKTFLTPTVEFLKWIAQRVRELIGTLRQAGSAVRDVASTLTFGWVESSSTRQSRQAEQATPAAPAPSPALRQEIIQQNEQVQNQIRALGEASNHAAILALRARGAAEGFDRSSDSVNRMAEFMRRLGSDSATVERTLAAALETANRGTIRQTQELHRQLVLRQSLQQSRDASAVSQLQISGLRETTALSMSAGEAQLRQRLATEGLSSAQVEEAASALRRNEVIAAQLGLMRQQIALADQWRASSRTMASTTEAQRANPLLTGAQAGRQAQIAELEYQLRATTPQIQQGGRAPAPLTGGGFFGRYIQEAQTAQQAIERAAAAQRLAQLRAADAQLVFAEAMERGRQLTMSLQNPMEVFDQRMQELDLLANQGAIDQQTYMRGVQQAADTLQRASNETPAAAPSALSEGSTGALRAIREAQASQDANDPQRAMQRTLDAQQAIQQAQLEAQQATLSFLQEQGYVQVAGFGAGGG